MIRPELTAWARRNGEVLAMLGLFAFGLWIATRGGWVLAALGTVVAVTGAILMRNALMRMRFSRGEGDPGVVIVDERRVGYFGPDTGGFFEMGEIRSVELMTYPTGAHWTLRGPDSTLIIPVTAKDAGQLFEVFSALPGFPMSRAVRLVEGERSAATHVLWREARRRAS